MATPQDAELILKLYELRTEPTMREARKFMGGFNPSTFEEAASVQRDPTSPHNAHWRQVLSYWDMAAAFVIHGALDGELFVASNGEPFFYYAKFAPFLEEWQKTFGMPFMRHTAMVIEKVPSARARYEAALARMRKR